MTPKERAAMEYMLNDGLYFPKKFVEQLNFEGGYEYHDPYTLEEVQRVIAMIYNMCGV
tara:strand:- start:1292 stop:1465 length:174 start_codon:yes stop_codon:yes gene_type:complete